MNVKISTLSEKAQKQYAEIAYSLEGAKGSATQKEILQYLLETISDVEEVCGDPVSFVQEVRESAQNVKERLINTGHGELFNKKS